ncbi:MAG: hypothetical protein COT81_03925 [Candidatus Buchananbacteria bacterium CG10_big_fil_rev_8_21_14_0_10_42_9]|uniref:Ferritin-like domain-containing protein n=1 Tax=Candidatus Buchananbacteria bacterium CG10_big_fil_rev_8_21_14_0_10_42_9 TaxID=1974526 RepID=A0A2H0W0M6_9BACT|nr:MAG: hypothetical protein COT81_03925 [Candidatus Buchananbacteria bacterium CG10_big_fil_rev_8_21_14_0_10_42_9]
MISDQELYILSYYRACELAGAILFGKLAFHTNFENIRIPLTEHALEESRHAWRWTETIEKLGRIPLKVTQAYQTEYGKEYGMPTSILEILCLTQVFEKRTLDHFNKHLALPGTHDLVKATLQELIDDETGHVSWVRKELDDYIAKRDEEEINAVMKKMEEVDKKVFERLSKTEPFKEYFKELL